MRLCRVPLGQGFELLSACRSMNSIRFALPSSSNSVSNSRRLDFIWCYWTGLENIYVFCECIKKLICDLMDVILVAYFNILPGSEWSALILTHGFALAIICMALKFGQGDSSLKRPRVKTGNGKTLLEEFCKSKTMLTPPILIPPCRNLTEEFG